MNVQVQVMKIENGKIYFHKEYLIEEAMENSIYHEILGNRRWSIDHWIVFPFQDKFYSSTYSVGATECQDESPYEYDEDWVECKEVVQVEKTIKVWENVKK
jgi:hypothetical protein